MKKKIIVGVIILIVVAAGSFFGGMKYGQSKSAKKSTGNFQGLPGNGTNGTRRGGPGMANANFASGEIITKDDKSITIKLRDGGSKIIFLPASAKVTKQADGTLDDLAVGTNVTVNGTANADGSINAQTIQLRPAGDIPNGPAGNNSGNPQNQNSQSQ